MAEQCQDTLRCAPEDLRQAMSVHTRKITDSCRDKDCIEDLRVYLTQNSQTALDSAAGARVRCAELLYSGINVEPVAFDRNHYCIDVTFYYQITADAITGGIHPTPLYGLALFTKRAVLCGEDSQAHIYRSDIQPGQSDCPVVLRANGPTAVVEVLDPMVLGSRIREVGEGTETGTVAIPPYIQSMFDDALVLTGGIQRLYVTLGQFSIIRLERDAQLIVPVLDYAIPDKECCDNPGCAEDPCELFSRIPFPKEQFTPTGCDRRGCTCDGTP